MGYPVYEPGRWNNDKCVLKSHNCYMYALNIIDKRIVSMCKRYMKNRKTFKVNKKKFKKSWEFMWARPGKAAGISFTRPYGCDIMIKSILMDSPSIKFKGTKTMNFNCPKNYYRIALCQNDKGTEFHFYRQDKNGFWSHKNGWRKATNKDCDGRFITDPKYSNNGIYKVFCGYFLVPCDSSKKRMSNITRKKK